MGGWYAFPGGARDKQDEKLPLKGRPAGHDPEARTPGLPDLDAAAGDADLAPGILACAVRELFEEAGILLGAGPPTPSLEAFRLSVLNRESLFRRRPVRGGLVARCLAAGLRRALADAAVRGAALRQSLLPARVAPRRRRAVGRSARERGGRVDRAGLGAGAPRRRRRHRGAADHPPPARPRRGRPGARPAPAPRHLRGQPRPVAPDRVPSGHPPVPARRRDPAAVHAHQRLPARGRRLRAGRSRLAVRGRERQARRRARRGARMPSAAAWSRSG